MRRWAVLIGSVVAGIVVLGLAVSAVGLRLGAPAPPDESASEQARADAQRRLDDLTWAQSFQLDRGDFGVEWTDVSNADFRAVSGSATTAMNDCLGLAATDVQGNSKLYYRTDLAYVVSTGLVAKDVDEAKRLMAVTAKPAFGQCVADKADLRSDDPTAAKPTARLTTAPVVGDESSRSTLMVRQKKVNQPVPFNVELVSMRSGRALSVLYVAKPVDAGDVAWEPLLGALRYRMDVTSPDRTGPVPTDPPATTAPATTAAPVAG